MSLPSPEKLNNTSLAGKTFTPHTVFYVNLLGNYLFVNSGRRARFPAEQTLKVIQMLEPHKRCNQLSVEQQ